MGLKVSLYVIATRDNLAWTIGGSHARGVYSTQDYSPILNPYNPKMYVCAISIEMDSQHKPR